MKKYLTLPFFLLCTTEPEKLITPLRSRCAEYHFKKPTDENVRTLLEKICEKENIKTNDEILEAIIKKADGNFRTALLELDKIKGIKDLNKDSYLEYMRTKDDKLSNVKILKINKLKSKEPFKELFAISEDVCNAIKEDMRLNRFDYSKPIDTWKGRNIIVDGHIRYKIAIELGIQDVPVYEHEFKDDDEALCYAIHNQRDRRNLTDAELLKCIELVDKKKEEVIIKVRVLKNQILKIQNLIQEKKQQRL